MPPAVTHLTTTIMSVDRKYNNGNGNPGWKVNTTDGTFDTEPDASVAYGIANSEYQTPAEVTLTLRGNKVIGINTVDGNHPLGATQAIGPRS